MAPTDTGLLVPSFGVPVDCSSDPAPVPPPTFVGAVAVRDDVVLETVAVVDDPVVLVSVAVVSVNVVVVAEMVVLVAVPVVLDTVVLEIDVVVLETVVLDTVVVVLDDTVVVVDDAVVLEAVEVKLDPTPRAVVCGAVVIGGQELQSTGHPFERLSPYSGSVQYC